MSDRLDKAMARLKAEAPDARLAGLETRVWGKIAVSSHPASA